MPAPVDVDQIQTVEVKVVWNVDIYCFS